MEFMKDFDDALNELGVIDMSIDAFDSDVTETFETFFKFFKEGLVCGWIEEWFIGRIECGDTSGR